MQNKIDVVVVGSANIDQTVVMKSLPETGETVMGKEMHIAEGGKGANQAVAAARLGAQTAFVGCVGDDDHGVRIRNRLHVEKIHCDYLYARKGIPTGSAFIFLDQLGHNVIAIISGANECITCQDIKHSAELISQAKIVLLQHEIPLKIVADCVKIAHKAGVKVILNPAPAREIPDSLLACTTCIIPNEVEAEKITSISFQEDSSLDRQANWFHYKGVGVVIITRGEKGVYVSGQDRRVFIPAVKVNPVDSVAAGDCFCGALAAALVRDMDWYESAKFATKAASIAVTRQGAMDSLPVYQEIKHLLMEK